MIERKTPPRWALWTCGALLAAFFLQSAAGLHNESAAFDETGSVGTAFLAFRKGDLRLVQERPPLLGLFTTVPLMALAGDPELPAVIRPEEGTAAMTFGDAFLHYRGNDPLRILWVSRYCVLVLSVLLGALLAFWSFRLGGPEAAVISSFLFALSPNLLAHSHIAATDMMGTLFVFLAVFLLDRWLAEPGPRNAAAAGAAAGFALTAKISGALLGPLFAGALAFALRKAGPAGKKRAWGVDAGAMTAACLFTVGLSMGGRFDYGAFFESFSWLYRAHSPGYLFYLGGKMSVETWWYYYLYAAAIKTPLPALLLAAAGTWVLARDRSLRREAVLIGCAVAAFLLASCFDGANLGLRRILPVYPFLVLAAGQAAPLFRSKRHANGRAAAAVLLALWQLLSVLRVSPYYMTYFNELIGGPSRGIYHLDDSNIDWGQGLPALKRWLDAHPGELPYLKYHGTAHPRDYGINLPTMPDAEVCSPRKTLYAVSAHYAAFFERVAGFKGPECSWLRNYKPVARPGNAFFIYDFR